MASISRTAELACLIQLNTAKVDNFITSQGLPPLSFDISMPSQLQLPDTIVASSNVVIEATDELHALMLGPMSFVFHQIDSTVNGPIVPIYRRLRT